jgi:hypothetical protein
MKTAYNDEHYVVELVKELKTVHKMKNKDILRKVREKYSKVDIRESDIPRILKKGKRWESERLYGRRR